jgi:hypothetical protein
MRYPPLRTDWWRSELERTGKRPSTEAVGSWYAAHAASCWGTHAPSLEETRTHAKCLRSVGSIREYFRGYRARKRARQSEVGPPYSQDGRWGHGQGQGYLSDSGCFDRKDCCCTAGERYVVCVAGGLGVWRKENPLDILRGPLTGWGRGAWVGASGSWQVGR